MLATARATLKSNRVVLLFMAIHFSLSWSGMRVNDGYFICMQLALWIAGYLLIRGTLVFAAEPL